MCHEWGEVGGWVELAGDLQWRAFVFMVLNILTEVLDILCAGQSVG